MTTRPPDYPTTRPPDILFIVLDTQRADRLGCYGYDKPLTPNLDRFAEGGVVFEQAIAPAQWTVPSHASMFTGLYPTVHQLTQSSQRLNPALPHLGEILSKAGYETVGFCNNPLVGVLNNGFKRGFQHFYNYGGAIPSLPQASSALPWPLNQMAESYTQFLRRISYPIQNYFGQSDLAFRLSLKSWATPLWSKMANFKGQNARSVKDVSHFLRQRETQDSEKPLFLFLNLMETHLPFWPPGHYVDRVAPYIRDSKEARTIMRTWNREAYRWAAPLADPLGDLESKILNDMYDAEVAYQDDYLGELFSVLDGRAKRSNTLTIIVADHGDGLGEHGYMGHAFVAYQELVHVPLIVDWPERWPQATRVASPVSARRVFHTMLETLETNAPERQASIAAEAQRLTLRHTANGRDPENGTAFSEIYPPMNFVRAIKQRQPHLLEQFRCLSERRAIVREGEGLTHKLIHLDEKPDELFDLAADPLELNDIRREQPILSASLDDQLKRMAGNTLLQRVRQTSGAPLDITNDAQLMQRLRGLGYLD
ncbi:MAG: sulfatase-like hydrolase/transferase [Chloroflexi bacterium]|nr:sulfatase-like hydrolase/transferase [Chloroflexota bacterium]